MSDVFLGQIIMFAGNFAPRNFALCNGQLLSIAQNQNLFSLLERPTAAMAVRRSRCLTCNLVCRCITVTDQICRTTAWGKVSGSRR